MRRALFAVVALATLAMIASMAVGTHAGADGRPTQYVVLYEANASPSAVKAAIRAAKGRILKANNKVGVATVISSNARFRTDAAGSAAIKSVARNIPIGRADPKLRLKETIEVARNLKAKAPQRRSSARFQGHDDDDDRLRPEPLAHLQWDMRMINATVDGSYRKHKGSKRVLVGILDTGIDGSHRDIAPNFSRSLSRNFTTDIPLIDGPCNEERDGSCSDPNDVDENLHGTHVASSVASPINKFGIAGVAPGVTLVNLRAGQDSGFFFLQASVDALTYAGDHGIDVANMSYFIDPWLYNCGNPLHPVPEDSPADRAEQKTIIEATQRALDYAHLRGVTLVAALGNGNHDISVPSFDGQSPNFPPNNEHDRTVNNTCLDLPTEGNNVISVSALGPSKRKADYSNWGYGDVEVSAPGGWFRDEGWSPTNPAGGIPNLILGALPKNVAEDDHLINPDGTPANPQVLRHCVGSTCAYYIYIQGTSMASPHAAGVAALIVSKYGQRGHGGVTLHPQFTEAYLQASATDTGCELMRNRPDGTFSYEAFGTPTSPRGANYTTYCEGTEVYNGVYGHGIVDALGALTFGRGNGADNGDDD
jgi:lantibiotic leader peptide-processing serine protease